MLCYDMLSVIFSCFLREIEGKYGWIIVGVGGGGAKGMLAPSQIICGGGASHLPPPPLPPLFLRLCANREVSFN